MHTSQSNAGHSSAAHSNAGYGSVEEAYLSELRETFRSPSFFNAPRGFPSRERLGVSFTVRDPVRRQVALARRRSNLVFNFAEALWYLSGSASLDFIAHYAPGIRKYSADGVRLTGTAYGPRIFRYPGGGSGPHLDQWRTVRDVLAEDPDSKRAVIQIFDPAELREPGNIDVACTLSLQFLIREGKLHGVGSMRANDAYRGMVSDIFSFTFLQELLARELSLDVGTYVHQVGSLHVYDSDLRQVTAVLAEAERRPAPPDEPFPAMPPGDNWPHVREVLALEAGLRADALRLGADDVRALPLPRYWQDVVALLELHRRLTYGTAVGDSLPSRLPPLYRRMMSNRWPGSTALAAASPAPEVIR
ncbi:thymidylate synthase [Streptomyces sp. NPDC053048]|uniref:thymidylate synthase n=1 Tax=Streptomyces sp. NPDC053048 TaxID=3365694 RepID=UPI0037D46A88